MKLQLAGGKEEQLEGFKYPQEGTECIIRIDAVKAEADGACEFYQDAEDDQIFVESVAPEYLSLCRTRVVEINDVLAWSGYEVFNTKSDWHSIILKNTREGQTICLCADGSISSAETLSSELTDALRKAHDMYWSKE